MQARLHLLCRIHTYPGRGLLKRLRMRRSRFGDRVRGNPDGMIDRGMADDSSEQVPGQQTTESSRDELNRESGSSDTAHNEASADKGLGDGPHAGEGTPG
jgi:hypothetical protein